MRGVFIKHISPDSPAAHNGTLRTGDRILEVCVYLCLIVCVCVRACICVRVAQTGEETHLLEIAGNKSVCVCLYCMRVSEWPRDQKSVENRIVCICGMCNNLVSFGVSVV